MSGRLTCSIAFMTMFVSLNAMADIITENTSFTNATVLTGFVDGQSITTPTGGPWNNIEFSFEQCADPSFTTCLSTTTNTPFALGDLFLLSEVYDGLPADLSSATPGFIAEATTISAGAWVFSSSVTLNPDTQYFFYMNTPLNGPELLYSTANPYPGGQYYEANSGNGATYGPDDSILAGSDHVFTLSGSPVPEPSTTGFLFFAVAALAGAGTLRRRAGQRGTAR